MKRKKAVAIIFNGKEVTLKKPVIRETGEDERDVLIKALAQEENKEVRKLFNEESNA